MPPADALTSLPPDSAYAYCRDARRLRHRFRHDRAALHQSLRALADREDARRPDLERPVRPISPGRRPAPFRVAVARRPAVRRQPLPGVAALSAPAEAVGRFAALVEAALEEGLLRQSRRQALLRDAAGLGIEPFEATLVIAAVEHRRATTPRAAALKPTPVTRPTSASTPSDPSEFRSGTSVRLLVAATLLTEFAGVVACWVATRA